MRVWTITFWLFGSTFACPAFAGEPWRVGVFSIDASPPIGSVLAYDPVKKIGEPLSCRGIVLLGGGQPIVMCAIDWIGIGNDAHVQFRNQLAHAVATTPERVAVHTLHQHDAPWCDFEMDELLIAHGMAGRQFDSGFAREMMRRAAAGAKIAARDAQPVSHIGFGQANVAQVASNRRILGPDGRVKSVRFTATKDPLLQAAPVGVVDPVLKLLTLYDGGKPIVTLTSFATHPQSYYRTGIANPDFLGMARNAREAATKTPHIHFNGAGGNVGAGKFNDGSPAMRPILAQRVEAAMTHAWQTQKKQPIELSGIEWRSCSVKLPPAGHLDEAALMRTLEDAKLPIAKRSLAAGAIVFGRRCRAGLASEIGCLRMNDARILSVPGELFVEYQLAAQKMRPDLFVMMAAYGDYGPSYIGTAISYQQGGYETLPSSSFVSPAVEPLLLSAIHRLLEGRGAVPENLGSEAAAEESRRARQH